MPELEPIHKLLEATKCLFNMAHGFDTTERTAPRDTSPLDLPEETGDEGGGRKGGDSGGMVGRRRPRSVRAPSCLASVFSLYLATAASPPPPRDLVTAAAAAVVVATLALLHFPPLSLIAIRKCDPRRP